MYIHFAALQRFWKKHHNLKGNILIKTDLKSKAWDDVDWFLLVSTGECSRFMRIILKGKGDLK
jgi:hypothetical protein